MVSGLQSTSPAEFCWVLRSSKKMQINERNSSFWYSLVRLLAESFCQIVVSTFSRFSVSLGNEPALKLLPDPPPSPSISLCLSHHFFIFIISPFLHLLLFCPSFSFLFNFPTVLSSAPFHIHPCFPPRVPFTFPLLVFLSNRVFLLSTHCCSFLSMLVSNFPPLYCVLFHCCHPPFIHPCSFFAFLWPPFPCILHLSQSGAFSSPPSFPPFPSSPSELSRKSGSWQLLLSNIKLVTLRRLETILSFFFFFFSFFLELNEIGGHQQPKPLPELLTYCLIHQLNTMVWKSAINQVYHSAAVSGLLGERRGQFRIFTHLKISFRLTITYSNPYCYYH